MNPHIATVLWALFVAALFWADRQPRGQTSKALWIPMFWLFIAASRNVTDWFHYSGGAVSDQYLEGSPLDRAALSLILAAGVVVLIQRRDRVAALLRNNAPILLFFAYCGISALWSDYPDVSFKRWFRASGDVVMVLVVLSEHDWVAALQRLMARLGYLLITLSVLFIRYYPDLGRVYAKDGTPEWCGVSTDKNALGMLCLVIGLAFIYRFISVYRKQEGGGASRKNKLMALAVTIVLALYLIREAHSATALSCFVMGTLVMLVTRFSRFGRKPAVASFLVGCLLAVAISALFLQVGGDMVKSLGRDSTLTGRTNIWRSALGQVHNPILGTGFESFWLGKRLQDVIIQINQGVNQAHNGYIEIYLNLGAVGVILLLNLLITGYLRIMPDVRRQVQLGSLRLAFWISAVAYNFTEAGFKMMNPTWFALLFSVAVLPKVAMLKRASAEASLDAAEAFTASRTLPATGRDTPELVTAPKAPTVHAIFSDNGPSQRLK